MTERERGRDDIERMKARERDRERGASVKNGLAERGESE